MFLGETVALRDISGIRLCESVYARDSRVPRHAHDAMFFSLTLSGGYIERHGRTEIAFGPGSASFHPEGDEHELRLGSGSTRCLNVEVDGRWRSLAGQVGDTLVRQENGPLLWLMARLHMASRSPFVSAETIENLVLEMFGAVGGDEVSGRSSREPAWLRWAEEIVVAEFRAPFTVIELAHRVGVHPVHLSRTWRRFRGCSIPRTVHRLRVDAACRRMTEGDVSLADLSAEAGFADQSHFSHVFRQITGTTPGRFLRSFGSTKRSNL